MNEVAHAGRSRLGGLLLVRYCGFQGDARFSPWFGRQREALEQVARTARELVRGGGGREALERLRGVVDGALEASDPEGPPFEAEIVDHLVFATDVLDFLDEPDDGERLDHALARADELAGVRDEMAAETGEASDFATWEADLRRPDADAALARSESFGRAYAAVLRAYYTDADAGLAG